MGSAAAAAAAATAIRTTVYDCYMPTVNGRPPLSAERHGRRGCVWGSAGGVKCRGGGGAGVNSLYTTAYTRRIRGATVHSYISCPRRSSGSAAFKHEVRRTRTVPGLCTPAVDYRQSNTPATPSRHCAFTTTSASTKHARHIVPLYTYPHNHPTSLGSIIVSRYIRESPLFASQSRRTPITIVYNIL